MSPLLLLLFACAEEPAEPPDRWVAVDEGGWFDVYTEEDEVTARGGETLALQIWTPGKNAVPGTYDYGDVLAGDGSALGAPRCPQPWPVILFSHGNGGLRYQSFFFTEHAASRGFVVVAPDHTGNTTFDLDDARRGEIAIRRPFDVADSFDWLVERANDPEDDLYGCIEPEAGYAIVGHSFGGYTTFATAGAVLDLDHGDGECPSSAFLCEAQEAYEAEFGDSGDGDLSDPRVWAAVPWAPAGKWALDASTITVPTMVIGGTDDRTTTWDDEVKPLYEELTATPRYLSGLDRVGHFSFTDFCIQSDDGCGPDFMPIEDAKHIISLLTVAFLETELGETRSAAWLPPDDPSITWTEGP